MIIEKIRLVFARAKFSPADWWRPGFLYLYIYGMCVFFVVRILSQTYHNKHGIFVRFISYQYKISRAKFGVFSFIFSLFPAKQNFRIVCWLFLYYLSHKENLLFLPGRRALGKEKDACFTMMTKIYF